MLKLEQIIPQSSIRGILPDQTVWVVSVHWFGNSAIELTYKDASGRVANRLLYREDELNLELVERGRPWSFNGNGDLFRLVSEAQRIRLAYLFDPLLAVHTSLVEPLPHQITAVYECMLPRQPLRFLLADDPGAGKTIMAGLYIKELMVRGDLQRCLIVCPGSLVEQWQDELYSRFHLPFEILTNDKIEASRTGNWFLEQDLIIARLDKLARDETLQEKLKVPDCRWDLIVCDEAHKMSASFFGGEISYTKRFQLGRLLSSITRHFILMTATPHNGKEEDFQLFLSLLDGDRFEGRFRDGVHTTDVSDLMRRMVKEQLVKFDGRPLFPQRIANTVPYRLSSAEASLYAAVTAYVRDEFNRADALQNNKRAGTVGFALTILQRRLASSPEAIYQSLRRRRERLESRLREYQLIHKKGVLETETIFQTTLSLENLEDIEDIPDSELEQIEDTVLDDATAARTIEELKTEIATLKHLEEIANSVRKSGVDTKWGELSNLVQHILGKTNRDKSSQDTKHEKIVIFTEHRDTLNYLRHRLSTLLGRDSGIVCIHGGMGREDRIKAQEAFKYNPEVLILLATDAAGEGINLQRAHLMINYDLPWNPNRIEQRFGRIHRIGQTEVCFLWNLVAIETREGYVYYRLLEKLSRAREALGGQVFDVLGKLSFEGKSLRELLIEAIRYGEQPDVQDYLNRVIEHSLDQQQLRNLIEERALVHDVMDDRTLRRVREDMERAEARRLQPHYIESFFLKAFTYLGGTIRPREEKRYEITHVPAIIRNRDRLIGNREPLLSRYERVTFEKEYIHVQGKPLAAFVCPGVPLLDAVIDLVLERNRDVLKQGTVLVDERDLSTEVKVYFYLEHALQDASRTRNGEQRVISKRVLYVQVDREGSISHIHYAPYLDFRPLAADEPDIETILRQEECGWISHSLIDQIQEYTITKVVPEHLKEVKEERMRRIEKTKQAVRERLLKEIGYWDQRAEELRIQEQAGHPNARLNSEEARKRADLLQARLKKRLADLEMEAQISPLPPVLQGGFVVVPLGLIHKIQGKIPVQNEQSVDTQIRAAQARAIVMEIERTLGFEPVDREKEKLGYDIESRDPKTGKLRFIEVKGRDARAKTITVTRNEILYSLNKPDNFILAIVEFTEENHPKVYYVRRPFRSEPEFGVVSQNYDFDTLIAMGADPFNG